MNRNSGERWLQQVLDAMTEQIAVVDRQGTILMVNEAWKAFGFENGNSSPSCFGVNYLEVCRRASMQAGESGGQARRVLEGLRAVLEGKLAQFLHEYACHSPTERRWFVLTATPLTADPGGAVITHINVTARKIREQAILRQAHQDPLTGLANRRRIEALAVQELANARRSGRSAAVLVIDLDGFKAINDTFGHAVGDLVLREVGARLTARTRPPGLLARLGGDEFVVLLPGVDAREAEAVVEAYRSVFSLPLSIDGRELRLGGSVGLALYPSCCRWPTRRCTGSRPRDPSSAPWRAGSPSPKRRARGAAARSAGRRGAAPSGGASAPGGGWPPRAAEPVKNPPFSSGSFASIRSRMEIFFMPRGGVSAVWTERPNPG